MYRLPRKTATTYLEGSERMRSRACWVDDNEGGAVANELAGRIKDVVDSLEAFR